MPQLSRGNAAVPVLVKVPQTFDKVLRRVVISLLTNGLAKTQSNSNMKTMDKVNTIDWNVLFQACF